MGQCLHVSHARAGAREPSEQRWVVEQVVAEDSVLMVPYRDDSRDDLLKEQGSRANWQDSFPKRGPWEFIEDVFFT